MIEPSELVLPTRSADGHKGSFGRVLVIAGSVGMSGAACLSATAALRGGAGLVTAAVPQAVQPIVAAFEPSYMTIGIPCSVEGFIEPVSLSDLPINVAGMGGIAVGPGLGQTSAAGELVRSVLRESSSPVILDADALNLTAQYDLLSQDRGASAVVVTPHPGEFARLTGQSIALINANRTELATQFARDHDVVVVLKGPRTVVTDGDRVYINATGNSGMATGGSGDVLTGLTAALLAQVDCPFNAAALAVWLHGLAGDLAAAASSPEALISSDLLNYIGAAWVAARHIQSE